MYKSKNANPKNIIFRCLDNEAQKLDLICARYQMNDRTAMIRKLINVEYVAQGLPPLALSHLVSSPELSSPEPSGQFPAPDGSLPG